MGTFLGEDFHYDLVRPGISLYGGHYNTKLKKWVDQRVISNYKLISKKVNIMYMDEMIHFLHCIENRKKTINDFNQGLDVLEIALAIRKASEKKKTVLV